VFLGPAIDIACVPVGGRTFESLGEDPLLQARMVVPEIKAIQSHSVVACIKHYLANNQEFKRSFIDVQIDERTLREIYLLPFVAAIQEGYVASIMGSYNRINGTYACENPFILNHVLREELGFRGFVMSDFFATHSTVESVEAELDWELGTKMWGPGLLQAVVSGDVSLALLDEMVRRILRSILGLGLADRPRVSGQLKIEEHSAKARVIAEQGIVLLKNLNGLLPLSPEKISSIAVIGADADNVSAAGGGSGYVQPTRKVSVLDVIKRRVGESVQVEYAAGIDPITAGSLLPGLPAIPSSFFSPEGSGLQVEYWDNTDFDGEPSVARKESQIELNYGLVEIFGGFLASSSKVLPKPIELKGRFSVRFIGALIIPESGNYVFSLTCLGSARLYIQGHLVLDSSTAVAEPATTNGLASVYVVRIPLNAMKSCSIRVDYANDVLGELSFNEAMLRLGWLPPEGVVSPTLQKAVGLAAASELALIAVRTYETEDLDRPTMKLPNRQDELIRAVASVNPNTIVVLMNAGPVELSSWERDVPAILEAWCAGQEQGSAIALILFGDVNPSGRLPITFPRNLEQTPLSTAAQYPGIADKVFYSEGLFVGYRGYDKFDIKPQYAFGYGFSYTTFEYSSLHVELKKSDKIQNVKVSFEITNTGKRAGLDVAQVYVGLPDGASAPPKCLVDWVRVFLEPGEQKQVSVILDANSSEHPLSFWDIDAQSWGISEGDFFCLCGGICD